MNENTAELAVHIAASGQNADAAQLCDSVTFMQTVTSLDPDKPGFVERVSGAVRDAVGANPAYRRSDPQPPPAAASGSAQSAPATAQPAPMNLAERAAYKARRRAELTPDYPNEITPQDCLDADPAVVSQWVNGGRLAHLGYGPSRRRGSAR